MRAATRESTREREIRIMASVLVGDRKKAGELGRQLLPLRCRFKFRVPAVKVLPEDFV